MNDIDKEGTILTPIIDGDRIYFNGLESLFCIDIEKGEIIWKFDLRNQEDIASCKPLIVDNKLYLLPENFNTLYCLDKHTGAKIWENNDAGVGVRKLEFAHGMVMYAAHHYLMVTNALNGKTIWKKKSPFENSKANFNGWMPIAINVPDSVIYISDKQNIMAIKMPELQ